MYNEHNIYIFLFADLSPKVEEERFVIIMESNDAIIIAKNNVLIYFKIYSINKILYVQF